MPTNHKCFLEAPLLTMHQSHPAMSRHYPVVGCSNKWPTVACTRNPQHQHCSTFNRTSMVLRMQSRFPIGITAIPNATCRNGIFPLAAPPRRLLLPSRLFLPAGQNSSINGVVARTMSTRSPTRAFGNVLLRSRIHRLHCQVGGCSNKWPTVACTCPLASSLSCACNHDFQ